MMQALAHTFGHHEEGNCITGKACTHFFLCPACADPNYLPQFKVNVVGQRGSMGFRYLGRQPREEVSALETALTNLWNGFTADRHVIELIHFANTQYNGSGHVAY